MSLEPVTDISRLLDEAARSFISLADPLLTSILVRADNPLNDHEVVEDLAVLYRSCTTGRGLGRSWPRLDRVRRLLVERWERNRQAPWAPSLSLVASAAADDLDLPIVLSSRASRGDRPSSPISVSSTESFAESSDVCFLCVRPLCFFD